MILIELQTDLTSDQWDTIMSHAETEKAVLLSILEFATDNMYTTNFHDSLDNYITNCIADLSEKNKELDMRLPVVSIRNTAESLKQSIKKSRSLVTFLKTVKHTVIRHTRFSYKGTVILIGNSVNIPEGELRFNVKCNLVGNRIIDNVSFCYKQRSTTFVCKES